MAKQTMTARTLAECKKRGWMAFVVERFNSYTKRSNDAFGFGDVLVVDDDQGALLIQATSKNNLLARRAKILGECRDEARRWLEAGNRIEVWGFWQMKDGRKLWQLTDTNITLGDFA